MVFLKIYEVGFLNRLDIFVESSLGNKHVLENPKLLIIFMIKTPISNFPNKFHLDDDRI